MAYIQLSDAEQITHTDFAQVKTPKGVAPTPKSQFNPPLPENKMNYKRLKALVCQPEKSNKDAKFIYSEIKDFNFFAFLYDQQNFFEEEAINLCKFLQYAPYRAGSTVYTEGDPVDFKIYLVLTGQLTKAVKKLDYYSAQNISKLKDKIKVIQHASRLFNNKAPSIHTNSEQKDLTLESRAYPMSIKSQEVISPTTPPPLKFSHHKSVDAQIPLTKKTSNRQADSIPGTKLSHQKSIDGPITMNVSTKKKLLFPTPEMLHEEEEQVDQADILKHIEEADPTTRLLGENNEVVAAARSSPHHFDRQKSIRSFKKKATIVSKDKGIVVDTKKPGDYFGESALTNSSKVRTESMIAITDCELLVIDKDTILKMKNKIEDSSIFLWNFLLNYMPGLDKIHSTSIYDSLVSLIEPKRLEKGAHLTLEGEKGNYFYIIKEGECEAFKTWTTNIESHHKFKNRELEEHYGLDKHITENLKIFVTTPGTFVGDEILFKSDSMYDYTVKVTTVHASVYMIEKNKFALRFPNDVFLGMKKMYENKKAKNDHVYHTKITFYLEEFDKLHQAHMQTDKINLSDLPSLEPINIPIKRSRLNNPISITIDTPEPDFSNILFSHSARNSELPKIRQKAHLTPEEQEIAKKLKQYQRAQAYLPLFKMNESPRSLENYRLMKEFAEQTSEIQRYKFDFGDNYDQRRLDILFNHLKRIHIIREPPPKARPENMETLPSGSYEERGEIIASNLLISSARILGAEGEEPYLKSISQKAVFSPKSIPTPSPRLSYMSVRREKISPLKNGHYFGREIEKGHLSPLDDREKGESIREKPHHQSMGDGVNFGKNYASSNAKIKIVKKVVFKPRIIEGVVRKVPK